MYKVRISNSVLVLDDAWIWAKENCPSFDGQHMEENMGGWRATFVFFFKEEKDASMFALRWK